MRILRETLARKKRVGPRVNYCPCCPHYCIVFTNGSSYLLTEMLLRIRKDMYTAKYILSSGSLSLTMGHRLDRLDPLTHADRSELGDLDPSMGNSRNLSHVCQV